MSGEPDRSLSSIFKPTFLQASTHAKNDLQEGNETLSFFNNIEIMRTPKRKSAVANLISDFVANTSILPGTEGTSESPAKRRRLWGQGGQGH